MQFYMKNDIFLGQRSKGQYFPDENRSMPLNFNTEVEISLTQSIPLINCIRTNLLSRLQCRNSGVQTCSNPESSVDFELQSKKVTLHVKFHTLSTPDASKMTKTFTNIV